MKSISIDIGGTFTKWAVLDENLKIVSKGKFETHALTKKAKGIMELVGKKANSLKKEYEDISFLGVSVPGSVDSKTGVIIMATKNIPESQGMNIVNEIGKYCDLPIKVINDANAAALGEMAVGSLKGIKNGVLVTLGTGIGAGIIINGEIYEGSSYSAGEVGRHFTGDFRWEDSYSTRSLINIMTLRLGRKEEVSGETIIDLYESNPVAKEVFEDWLNGIAKGLANIINILNPETLSVGGGISENDKISSKLIVEKLEGLVHPVILDSTNIVKATTGNDAALYGLALFTKQAFNK